MDFLTNIRSPYGTGGLYGYEIPNARGTVLFVHGFHSSSRIWTSDRIGLAEFFLQNNFNCYAIDFSMPTTGSLVTLADYELARAYQWITARNPSKSCVIIAHSMGGLITRYFLDKDENHPIHNPEHIAESKNILSVVLLATPNHGVALSKAKYKPATNNSTSRPVVMSAPFQNHTQDEEFAIKIKIKEFLNSNSSKEMKKLHELMKTSSLELRANSLIIHTLNDHLSANLWPELRWVNVVGNLDLVVDRKSAEFSQEEIDFLYDFHQTRFDVTHMKNPFAWLSSSLSKYRSSIDILTIEHNIEKFIPNTAYLTKPPIYADKQVQNYLGELILPLFL